MTSHLPPRPRKIRLELTVASEDQAAELRAAWQEIVRGKHTRLNTAEQDLEAIMERAMLGLQTIAKAIADHLGTGQGRRLVRFLAGCYNGGEYPFDLTDLRALDTELASACIDYLNYDRLAKAEVHRHLPGGGERLNGWIEGWGIEPRLRLSEGDEQAARLRALARRTGKQRDDLVCETIEELLARAESCAFGGLRAAARAPDEERPLVHARRLTTAAEQPLCGAADGPWQAAAFSYQRLTCPDCRDIVLGYER